MRQKLNENPVAQIALIGVLALVVGYMLLGGMGGGESEEEGAATPTGAVTSPPAEAAAGGASGSPLATAVTVPTDRSLPASVEEAYARGATVVLLVIRDGGIDDRLVKQAAAAVRDDEGVALFVVKAEDIARYAPIAGPLGVESAPALIVVRPKPLNGGGAAPATVDYGFQRSADVEQAIRDAVYRGPELGYEPQ